MAIFGKLKRALGLSESDLEDELSDDLPSAIVTPLNQRKNLDSSVKTSTTYAPSNSVISDNSALIIEEVDATLPDEIFESVVDFFNKSLPPFISENLDKENQRRQIYDSLSESMKRYIEKINEQARKSIESKYASEHAQMRRQMDSIQSRSKQIEEQATELKELKLSAERQKRALSERVHDLEAQIANFDAEREQYDLENKSLVNKIRLMSVQSDDIQTLTEDNQKLREQIRLLKTGLNPEVDNEQSDEIVSLNEKIEVLSAQNSALESDKSQLLEDVELLKKRCEIADTMINDLNKRASSAQLELSDREKQLAAHTEELEEAKSTIEMFEQTLTKFEEIKAAKDNTISELKAHNSELKSKIDELEAIITAAKEYSEQDSISSPDINKAVEDAKSVFNEEREQLLTQIESLKSTIENNLKMQAQSESALREEIEKLRIAAQRQRKSQRRRRPTDTALSDSLIDDTLDDTDWLISSPPQGEDARPSGVSDSEFGYQEPKRKNPGDNSAQMLLW